MARSKRHLSDRGERRPCYGGECDCTDLHTEFISTVRDHKILYGFAVKAVFFSTKEMYGHCNFWLLLCLFLFWVFFSREAPAGVWLRNGRAHGPFDDLDTEEIEVKECTSMALASGQWMNEQCNKGNFIICEKKISGKPIKLFSPHW